MKLCWRILCDIMLVTFIISTVLGVVHNTNQPKIRAAFRPRPFLVGPHVKDYYQGNVFQAFQDAGQFENSLLMFYAPWDRDSQEARKVMLEVGKFFSETDILIGAVNCWYPTSDCAKEFGGKASGTRYPVFIFYPAHLKGIQYRGPVRADHLISWVRRARYPLTPLLDLQHFQQLHTDHTSLLVGFQPGLAANRLDTNTVALLQCSHHLLETEPGTRVVLTSDPGLARTLHLHTNHPLRLFSWNSSLSYPNKTVDGAGCSQWALRQISRPAAWLHLPARKSLVLGRSLGDHSLLVFSPRLSLSQSYVETAVMEVAARYRNCNSTPPTSSLVSGLREKLAGRPPPRLARHCQTELSRHHCRLQSFSAEAGSETSPACLPAPLPNTTAACHLPPAPLRPLDQEVEFLLQEAELEERRAAEYGGSADWVGGLHPEYSAETDPVSGLACRDNRSLNILLVDSSPGGHQLLADSLGLQLSSQPSLAVVSLADETLSLVPAGQQNLSLALESSILAWHSSSLTVSNGLRSSERSSRLEPGTDTLSCHSSLSSSSSCLQQVTRDKFDAEVVGSNESTVLLYTSTYCSQCSVTAATLHTVSRLLAGLPGVQFRMVDTTRNDLSWQFTALAYPSIIFFPGKRKENSRVFPTDKELNSTSLLSFILSNLSPELRLRLALQSCDNNCVAKLKLHASHKLTTLDSFMKRRTISRSLINTRLGKVLVKQIRHVRYR